MPTWKVSKIITDLIWETLRDQLQNKLRSIVEDKVQWDDVSERVRRSLLNQLNKDRKEPKQIKSKAE